EESIDWVLNEGVGVFYNPERPVKFVGDLLRNPRWRVPGFIALSLALFGVSAGIITSFGWLTIWNEAGRWHLLGFFSLFAAVLAVIGQFRRLRIDKHLETVRRIRAEQNLEISMALHGMAGRHDSPGTAANDLQIGIARSHKIALSGDWIHLLSLKDGSRIAILGDVYGGGVGATLVASAILGALCGLQGVGESVEKLLQALNYVARHVAAGDVMSSAVVIHYRNNGWCEVFNAGHAGVVIARGNGSIEFVSSLMPPLGAMEVITPLGISFAWHLDDKIIVLNSGSAKGARGLRTIAKIVTELPDGIEPDQLCRRICEVLEFVDKEDDHVVACVARVAKA
ncbi:MAG: SpoIIE family protein phosphatase, partial [Proteobacteria bacterium]|nr:SpoIIE family protein phosphatase [Pseudomonadota bacterium]